MLLDHGAQPIKDRCNGVDVELGNKPQFGLNQLIEQRCELGFLPLLLVIFDSVEESLERAKTLVGSLFEASENSSNLRKRTLRVSSLPHSE